jgi:hypothetical protein
MPSPPELAPQIPDDLNNVRIRQLIEQFNAEEACEADRQAAMEELRKLFTNPDLAALVAAFGKLRWKLPPAPPVNAIGIFTESASPGR